MKRLESSQWFTKTLVWFALMAVFTTVMFIVWFIWGDPQSVSSLKWLQLMQSFAVFVLPAICGAWLWSARPFEWLHLDRGFTWRTALYAIAIMIAALPGINLLSDLNRQLSLPAFLEPLEAYMKQSEEAAKVLTEQFLEADNIATLLLNIGLMALLPAIGEELSFRGVLQGLFPERYRHTAIWVTAAIFSFIHFQFYGFVPRMLMGALFGYMLVWTGSLWVPVLMHFTNNALAVLAYYISDRNELPEEFLESFGAGEYWWIGIVSIVISGVLIRLFVRGRS